MYPTVLQFVGFFSYMLNYRFYFHSKSDISRVKEKNPVWCVFKKKTHTSDAGSSGAT